MTSLVATGLPDGLAEAQYFALIEATRREDAQPMTSIDSLAAAYDMEPYAVADALNLGTEWDATAELDDATAAEYTEVLDIMAQQAADLI